MWSIHLAGENEFKVQLIATCAFGLEAIVARELDALGYAAEITGPGRILFDGDASAICRANLWLRTADRVLVRMAHFPATDFDQLFDTTQAVAWHDWIVPDGKFPVVGRSLKSQLSSVPACQRSVKKAVVESLLAGHGVQTLAETGPLYKIEVSLLKDQVTLTLDTTGPSLHKRGYRKLAARAPLKETLAAAMVQLSYWRRDRPLIDPFCGSGTIPIEAALIGCNLAPGRLRRFTAEDWPNVSRECWEAARSEAADLAEPDLALRIVGTDIDAKVLDLARYHAGQAGVDGQIHFQQRPFAQLASKHEYGCVVTNPPYGQRLSEYRDIEPLYRSLPAVLRRLPTWSHYILTPYPDFERLIEKQADRRRKLYNGRIECTLYQFHGPKPETKQAVPSAQDRQQANESPATAGDATETEPAFGGITAKARQQAELFRNRLAKRARHLRRWPTRRGITCYRLYDRDIPEVPLVVDRYEDHLHIAEYERPHDRDLGQHADWLDLMARTAGDVLDVTRGHTFVKQRSRQRGTTQHQHLSDQHYELTVQEGGLKFVVNLSDYIDTGLFLDHRLTRGMVRDAAEGTNFLNLFGYTGAFTVYAAAGGAARTTTVDWSGTYLDWARRNMALNDFSDDRHQFIRCDAVDFLQQPSSARYDLAVVDPPTYSNSKRTTQDWDVQRDHALLLNQLLTRMKSTGVIYFSTNFRRFKLDEAGVGAGHIREISRQTVPEDYRNKRIHRCWRISVSQPAADVCHTAVTTPSEKRTNSD